MTTTIIESEKPLKNVKVDVRESASTDHVHEKHDVDDSEHVQWETGFWKRFPWLGFAAIVTMLLCIAMDGVILGTSRGRYREEWPAHQKWKFISEEWRLKSQIGPNVLLAIVNTITNVALGIAIGHGVAIAWWRRVLKGSTIEDLHRSWGFSASVLELMTAGRMFNYIALAALMAKVALIDNVLLQQAVGTEPGYYWQNETKVSLPMAKALPSKYAGLFSDDDLNSAVSYAWSDDLFFYYNGSDTINPLNIFPTIDGSIGHNTGCAGWCDVAFEGFGFQWDCSPVLSVNGYQVTPDLAKENNLTTLYDAFDAATSNISDTDSGYATKVNAEYERIFGGVLQKNPVLLVESQFIPMNSVVGDMFSGPAIPDAFVNRTMSYGSIGIHMKYSTYNENDNNTETCTGWSSQRFCLLRPATVEYSLEITNVTRRKGDKANTPAATNGITLIPNANVNFSDPKYLDQNGYFSLTEYPTYGQFNGWAVKSFPYEPYDPTKYDSNLKVITSWLQSSFSTTALLQYVNTTEFKGYIISSGEPFASYWLQYDPSPICGLFTMAPLEYIAKGLNNLMVRASMHAATVTKGGSGDYGLVDQSQVQSLVQGQRIASIYYTTNWAYGGAAMGTIFFCLLCVLPSYWGFWQLGRKVTLGPIEVAGAFQAPVMDHPTVATHGEVDEFVKQIGQRRVRYGQVEGQQRLAVAPPTEVVRPGM